MVVHPHVFRNKRVHVRHVSVAFSAPDESGQAVGMGLPGPGPLLLLGIPLTSLHSRIPIPPYPLLPAAGKHRQIEEDSDVEEEEEDDEAAQNAIS